MNVETVLKQRGYKIQEGKLKLPLDEIGEALSFSFRKKQKEKMSIADYSSYFERLVGAVLLLEFKCPAICNVKIEGEGPGGDFDVLAINTNSELFYFECKTGNDIRESDFKNFFERHNFLKPEVSVMVFDQSKSRVKSYLSMMRSVVTKYNKTRDPNLARNKDWQCQNYKIIPEGREYAYHMNRNFFFCSGENISKAITHVLRHYYGVVKQTSYYS